MSSDKGYDQPSNELRDRYIGKRDTHALSRPHGDRSSSRPARNDATRNHSHREHRRDDNRAEYQHEGSRNYDSRRDAFSGSSSRRNTGHPRRHSPAKHDHQGQTQGQDSANYRRPSARDGGQHSSRHSDRTAPSSEPRRNYSNQPSDRDRRSSDYYHYSSRSGHSSRNDPYSRSYHKRPRSRTRSPSQRQHSRRRIYENGDENSHGSRHREAPDAAAVGSSGYESRQNGFGNTRDESLRSGRYTEGRRSRSRVPALSVSKRSPPPPPTLPPPPPLELPPPPPPPPSQLPPVSSLQPHSLNPKLAEGVHHVTASSSKGQGTRASDTKRGQQRVHNAPRHGKQSPKHTRPGGEGGTALTTTSTGDGGIGTPMTPSTPKARSPADGIQLYSKICMVGEGTYGKVYKARNRETGQVVALKRMRIDMEREGFPITAMREIRLLKQLQHPNITQVLDVVPESSNSVYVVMEYMDYDLSGLINHPQWSPEPAHKKSLMHQLLEGLEFMHARGILHRDIKGSNLLINRHGQIKYVDFGLARSFHHTRMQEFTNRVITLWYRPPELLLGTTVYGPEVDIWSLGCVLIELFMKKPIFQGQNDIDQLEQIFKILGTPSPSIWESFSKLPWACYMTPNTRYSENLREMLGTKMTAGAVDLISWMISLDPAARPSAKRCLEHRHFVEEPLPVPPTSFPVEGDWHEFESKMERRKRKNAAKTQHQQ